MSIYVIDPAENTRVPFLRGILTRSLRDAGLPFTDAYDIANKVRNTLGPDAEVSTKEVAKLVAKILKREERRDVLDRYLHQPQPPPIRVIDSSGPQPFSKGRLSQSLEICAFPQEECYRITTDIERQLIRSGTSEIDASALARMTYDHLREHEPPEMAQRYLVWIEYLNSGRPLILLVGGTTGSGKSTIGSEIAHRLNIVRAQSTDMLREVMRLLIPARLLSELHASSFSAWQTLPAREDEPLSFERHFLDGYLTQAREVGVGIEGVFQRALNERISLIIEGVHVFPALQQRLRAQPTDAIVVPMLIAVLKRKQLKKQLQGRGKTISTRRAERYLEHFDAIWELQSYLLADADRHDIAILPNVDLSETIRLALETISEHLAEAFTGKPKEVFA